MKVKVKIGRIISRKKRKAKGRSNLMVVRKIFRPGYRRREGTELLQLCTRRGHLVTGAFVYNAQLLCLLQQCLWLRDEIVNTNGIGIENKQRKNSENNTERGGSRDGRRETCFLFAPLERLDFQADEASLGRSPRGP